MLTIPAVSSTIAVTGTIISVGSARIRVAELIAGEDGGRAEGMGQDPYVSKCVRVACRVDCQSSPITFGIMVGDERVGGTAITGRVAIGLWTTERSNATALEGGFDVESILEGLELTDPCIFPRSNSGSAAVVDLYHSSVIR